MRSWCATAAVTLLLFGAETAAAQPGSLNAPPRIPLPAGINPRDTVLPGQRQSAPIFTPPKLGDRSQPAIPAAPENPKPNAPTGAAAVLPPGALPQEAPAGQPARSGGGYPYNPPPASRNNPYDNYSTQSNPAVVQPNGTYAPGSMQMPGRLGPPPEGAMNFAPMPGSSQGAFAAAMREPAAGYYGPAPGVGGAHGACQPDCCAPRCCDPYWFGTFGGLIMGRNSPNRSWLSAQKSDYFNQVMNGADAAAPWAGGWEASVGRFFPGFGGLQFTYWGLAPTTGFDSVRMPGDLVTPINLNDVTIGGVGADFFFDNAQEHRVQRKDEFNNIELNFIGLPGLNSGGPFQLTWLAGVRYFRFRDQLVFGAVHEGFEFGSDGGVNEAYLDVAMANNLIGPQIGALANWELTERCGFILFPRVGVFANQINQHFQLYRGDGLTSIDIASTKTVGSLLAQIDIGVNYFFTPNWSVYVGYRVVAVSGVGLSDAQIPPFLIDTPEIRAIDSNGDLILQGGTAGMIWRY